MSPLTVLRKKGDSGTEIHKNQMLNGGDLNTVRSRRVRGTIQCHQQLVDFGLASLLLARSPALKEFFLLNFTGQRDQNA